MSRLMCDVNMAEEMELRRLEGGRSPRELVGTPTRWMEEEPRWARAEPEAQEQMPPSRMPAWGTLLPAATASVQLPGPVPVVPCLVASAMPIDALLDDVPMGTVKALKKSGTCTCT